MHAGEFLVALGSKARGGDRWQGWLSELRARDDQRDREIAAKASSTGELVDPLHLFLRMEEAMAEDAALVVDGGDFVATGSYVLRPRAPLSWLDPGVFGTLGVGGGMALGAALARPGREVWLVWGDGSSAYSLAEFDSYVRHGVAPIAVIGNDASWSQIAREQVEVLGTSLGCDLRRTDYHRVAEGYGGVGLELRIPAQIDATLAEAKAISRSGRPVCINVHLRPTDFRKGSISI
jgi:acetolactate synthase-1/2/3 large subunit